MKHDDVELLKCTKGFHFVLLLLFSQIIPLIGIAILWDMKLGAALRQLHYNKMYCFA